MTSSVVALCAVVEKPMEATCVGVSLGACCASSGHNKQDRKTHTGTSMYYYHISVPLACSTGAPSGISQAAACRFAILSVDTFPDLLYVSDQISQVQYSVKQQGGNLVAKHAQARRGSDAQPLLS